VIVETRNVVLLILPFAVAIALSVGFLLIFRQRAAWAEEMRRRDRLAEPDLATPLRDPEPFKRPWWGNPWLWVGLSVIFLILGLVVWPALFGGVFLFLPFVWIWRPRPREVDPRTNGHAKREDPTSLGG
jgi:hypothetical protein